MPMNTIDLDDEGDNSDDMDRTVFARTLCSNGILFDSWRFHVPIFNGDDKCDRRDAFEEILPESTLQQLPDVNVNLESFWEAIDKLMKAELEYAEQKTSSGVHFQNFLFNERESEKNKGEGEGEGEGERGREGEGRRGRRENEGAKGKEAEAENEVQKARRLKREELMREREARMKKINETKTKLQSTEIVVHVNGYIRRLWEEKSKEERAPLYNNPLGYVVSPSPLSLAQLAKDYYAIVQSARDDPATISESTYGSSVLGLLRHVWEDFLPIPPMETGSVSFKKEVQLFMVGERGKLEMQHGDTCRTDLLAWTKLRQNLPPEKLGMFKWISKQSEIDLAIFAGEFKTLDILKARRQLVVALTPACASYALLGLDVPVFGFVITMFGTEVHVCKAKKEDDGTLSYAYKKLSSLPPLNDLQSFARFYGFLCAHREWFVRNVYKPTIELLGRYSSQEVLIRSLVGQFEVWRRLDIIKEQQSDKKRKARDSPGENPSKRRSKAVTSYPCYNEHLDDEELYEERFFKETVDVENEKSDMRNATEQESESESQASSRLSKTPPPLPLVSCIASSGSSPAPEPEF
ncbi:hypothetical protein K435DRAFT_772894 [Dendrothele bispora CBS 962.96]|uniref:Uncharacterized protein n=1 Tax=Dendrothele bispora (strain CBS 962.96) TaxID=1314807 RepID=A0A4S8MUW0_DENBC|nr:hypothetical protein K435DRAFT_772894 [Dendrothele bispora CBS 962.96]